MRFAWVLGLSIGLLAGACAKKGGEVDTTKDVYTEEEAPKVQIEVLNGVSREIPWAEVPERRRWFTEYGDHRTYKLRVPIVKVIIFSRDKEGRPVPPEQGWRVEYEEVGLNPKHRQHSYAGKDH